MLLDTPLARERLENGQFLVVNQRPKPHMPKGRLPKFRQAGRPAVALDLLEGLSALPNLLALSP